jgi:hypothetical protein
MQEKYAKVHTNVYVMCYMQVKRGVATTWQQKLRVFTWWNSDLSQGQVLVSIAALSYIHFYLSVELENRVSSKWFKLDIKKFRSINLFLILILDIYFPWDQFQLNRQLSKEQRPDNGSSEIGFAFYGKHKRLPQISLQCPTQKELMYLPTTIIVP